MSFLFCELSFHILWKVSVLCCLFLIAYRISWCTLQIRGGTPSLWPNFSMWWNVPGIDTLCLLLILSSEWFNALVRIEVSKHTLCHPFWVSLFMEKKSAGHIHRSALHHVASILSLWGRPVFIQLFQGQVGNSNSRWSIKKLIWLQI